MPTTAARLPGAQKCAKQMPSGLLLEVLSTHATYFWGPRSSVVCSLHSAKPWLACLIPTSSCNRLASARGGLNPEPARPKPNTGGAGQISSWGALMLHVWLSASAILQIKIFGNTATMGTVTGVMGRKNGPGKSKAHFRNGLNPKDHMG